MTGLSLYLALGERSSAPRQPKLWAEYERADLALTLFDEAQALAARAGSAENSAFAADLASHAWHIVREADPVRLSYAAAVLKVVDQTVRDWVRAGLLEAVGGSPQQVTLESVARVRELVRDLRAAGRQGDLMTAVLRELELDELRQDDRFKDSLAQMHRGERA